MPTKIAGYKIQIIDWKRRPQLITKSSSQQQETSVNLKEAGCFYTKADDLSTSFFKNQAKF
jgi:hypothetical protein